MPRGLRRLPLLPTLTCELVQEIKLNKTAGEYHFTRLETVVFGAGKAESLGRELARRGAKRALIVTGKTLGRSKLLDKVRDAAGPAFAGVFTGAAQHVPSHTVAELVAEAMGEADPPPFRPRGVAPVQQTNPRRRRGPAAQGSLFG